MTDPADHDRVQPPGSTIRRTTLIQLVAAWTLVGVPLAWGVWQVIQKSMALFR